MDNPDTAPGGAATPITGETRIAPKPLWRRLAASLVRIAVLLYALIVPFMWWYYPRLVYYPSVGITQTPAELGCENYENLWLTSADGQRVNAWFIPAAPGTASGTALLYLHGNAGNLSAALQRLMLYRRLGFDVFAVDYRGFGLSGGEPTEKGLYHDAEAAWECLVKARGVAPANIIIAGWSLGGGPASWLAERHPDAAGLILESTFTSLGDVAAHHFPYLPARLIIGNQYNTLGRLAGIRQPVLVAHSREDEVIPYRHGERLFAACPGEKTFLELHGDHNVGYMLSGREYTDGILKFAASLRRDREISSPPP